jgi:succinyl-diaminopimelate desuccinylase
VCRGVLHRLSDAELSERLARRTLELVDVPSESRDEAALAAHVAGALGVAALEDATVLAGPARPRVLLAGHLDTVPAQDNRPGRIEDGRVVGLGASDMKGALAVMIEVVLAGAPLGALFFPREELPHAESALTPLLARRPLEGTELVLMMEPTDNAIHAGCLGNINAAWTFRGRSGHSARPWLADNAIERAAAGIAALAAHPPEPHDVDGLVFREVASVTRIAGGIAGNVIPDRADAHLNYRYAPGRTPEAAEARLAELCAPHGELQVTSNAPSGAVPHGNALLDALIEREGLAIEPKQAWTPVAEFAKAGYDAVNLGPGSPAQAHRRDESVGIDALVRCARILDRLAEEL